MQEDKVPVKTPENHDIKKTVCSGIFHALGDCPNKINPLGFAP